jgi:hypothetical protein
MVDPVRLDMAPSGKLTHVLSKFSVNKMERLQMQVYEVDYINF